MSERTVVMSSILAAILMATAMTGTVLARGPQDPERTVVGKGGYAATSEARGSVDEGGDGATDRFALSDGTQMLDGEGNTYGYAYGFVDEDGDGVNDRYGQSDGTQMLDGFGNGYAYGFVDEDGDGVNDRYAQGDGVPDLDGDNFVDADGDGLCDNCADGECTPGTGENAVRQGVGRGGRNR